MDSKEIREALDDLDWAVQCLGARGQRGERMDKCFEHIKSLKVTLSTIDSEAQSLMEDYFAMRSLASEAMHRANDRGCDYDIAKILLPIQHLSATEPAQDNGKAEEYDMAFADFEDNTITLQVPSELFKSLGFAPCKIKADLSPLIELGKKRRIEEATE